MTVAPIFLLWPLMRFKVRSALRFLAGFALAAAIITAPWSIQNGWALLWILRVLVACSLPLFITLFPLKWRKLALVISLFVGALLLVRPLAFAGAFRLMLGLSVFVLTGITVTLVHRRDVLSMVSAVLAVAIFLCVPFYQGTLSWFEVGFRYGAEKFQKSIGGTSGVVNLGSLLQQQWGWAYQDSIRLPFNLLGMSRIAISSVMVGIYAAALVVASLALAMQDRRRDVRFLVALCTPWLAMYALLPEMHSRYLLWGATATATMVAVSLGLTLLHLLISLIATFTILIPMSRHAGNSPPQWLLTAIQGYDGLAWVVLLCTAIFFYLAFLPSRPGQNFANCVGRTP
jgi:hypothetical protein